MIVRDLYLNKLRKFQNTEFVKVITGVRRSGKTFILRLFRDELRQQGIPDDQIIFINFESMKYQDLLSKNALYDYVMKSLIPDKKMYLFFDEIQRVTGWEDVINSFRVDFDADIYVSGSNASLLSGELATLLTGRMVEIPIYPLSFKEYLQFRDITDQPERYFNDYITEGGFPAVALVDDASVKQSILDGIYSSILLRDVTERAQIRDDGQLTQISNYLLSEIGNLISGNKIAGVLSNEGFKTANATSVLRYINLLQNAFLFYPAKRYDIRGKAYLRTVAKYYAVDTGLRNTTLNRNYHDNFGHQIENIVYLELRRRGYQVDVGKDDTKEIDFIARKGNETRYYQVTMQLPDDNDREISNLAVLPDNFPKVVLTANRMDVGHVNGISVEYIIDWLLS
ncbi:ATP-binding protein [Companilactobacillus heilongjiangensis]|uniref:Nucleoside triphosphate hydrolase n=1 Tax=Companilactobacillus heilongjiangensis TaxID=1074467 RepID=A0A0K2LET2_9LACO|nr:ATP-binding protein [Companilactobacillus heilongjiangensis]ALB29780.1 nucleoside triphosphate hydrolase [Companilactobacillus heilongjiangensis]